MTAATTSTTKPYKGIAMEGMLATWYAKNTASSLREFQALAADIAATLPDGARILEVAPGPGYLSVELARLQRFDVTGLDVSHSFVRIAAENAARAGVIATFHQGDAAHLPFADASFDFIVCRAAFKNFSDPIGALKEMRRTLAPGGRAAIIDMRRDASNGAIAEEVSRMGLGPADAFFTRAALRSLKARAYSKADFERMTAEAGFTAVEIAPAPIGFEVKLAK